MRLFRYTGATALFLAAATLGPSATLAQRIGVGLSTREMAVDVVDHHYEIQGETARDILNQMRMFGPAGRWTSFPYRYRWTYKTVSVPTAFGYSSMDCDIQEFHMRFTVEAYYPRWDPPDNADAELVAAWEGFTEALHEYWGERKNFMIDVAREASRRVELIEETCGLARSLTNRTVREAYSDLNQAEARARTEGERVRVRWPPEGFEDLLSEAPVTLSEDRSPTTTPSAERVSGTFATAAAADIRPSGMTGVVGGLHETGEPDILEAWGFADEEEVDSLSPDDVFRFPAFSEAVVSILAETLDREGLVDLHAPLSSCLPELDEGLGSVTLYHLLHHQSGLDNAASLAQAWSEILDDLDDRALFTDPGVIYSYSKYDYPLAVRALERSIEEDLATAANHWVFEPLGMVNTSLSDEGAGLPVVLTTAPDLLRYASTLMEGMGGDGGVAQAAPGSPGLLDSRGRWFDGGLWHDLVEGEHRMGLICSAGAASDPVGFQLFPGPGTALVFWARTRNPSQVWPTVSAAFLLEGIGLNLGIESDLFEPRRVRGDGQLQGRSRLCEDPPPFTYRADSPGPPAPVEDWAGTYGNGDQIIELLDRDGLLRLMAGMGSELEVSHFKNDIYFATIAERPLWPFRLFKDESGRRYAVLGDRAYVHQEDRGA